METEKSDETVNIQNADNVLQSDAVSDEFLFNELNEHFWSVISFEKCEASGLNYQQAVQKLQELAVNGVSGLCIVTNEAAARNI